MITIEQLLESVELDFESRWVTKDSSGVITFHSDETKPTPLDGFWGMKDDFYELDRRIKVAEFANKDWQECIYEVPRTTTDSKKELVGNIEKLEPLNGLQHNWLDKINELVDAVNELKAKFALPTLNPDLTDEDLRKMMCDPKYWRDKDSATIQKVQDGFNKLYGDKN